MLASDVVCATLGICWFWCNFRDEQDYAVDVCFAVFVVSFLKNQREDLLFRGVSGLFASMSSPWSCKQNHKKNAAVCVLTRYSG